MPSMKVENLLVSTELNGEINFEDVGEKMPGARYQPDVFRGIIYEVTIPKALIFLYETGLVKVFGGRNLKEVNTALNIFSEKLSSVGYDVTFDEKLKIQNIIASIDVESKISAKKILSVLDKDSIDYNPTRFPGIVYRVNEEVRVIIFPEGKLVCYGTQSFSDASVILETLQDTLKEAL